METDFGDNYTQATPENDNTGTYQDNSDSYTRDNEVDQLNSDFANFQDFSRNSPKDTGIFGGGGAGDFGLGPKSKEKDNFLNEQMVDYYTKSRGATATNPYPDSFFSRIHCKRLLHRSKHKHGRGKAHPKYNSRYNEFHAWRRNYKRFDRTTGTPTE